MTVRGFTQLLMWNKRGRKRERGWRGENRVCRGKDREKKRNTAEKGQERKRENTHTEIRKGLNGDRK